MRGEKTTKSLPHLMQINITTKNMYMTRTHRCR
jgi:hypothetical protein